MSNRFVVTISDFPITGVSHPTAEEAGRKEGDGASHPGYSVAELVPVEEIEKLRASAAGEKVLEEVVGEQDRQANKDSDEIVVLMARVGNLEAKLATHETDPPGEPRRVLKEHKRQIEDYAVELRLADAKLARLAGVCDPAPDAEEGSKLHEQRLWEAYMVMLKSEQHETCEGSVLAASQAMCVFERYGQEGDKP